jgi:hypothetical protein
MADRNIELFRVLTRNAHDLADFLGCELRWRAGAGSVAQTLRHAAHWIRVPPPTAPLTDGFSPNPQLTGGLIDALARACQQDDARPFRQFLRCRVCPDQLYQRPFVLARQWDW